MASSTLRLVYGVPCIENVSRGMALVHPDDVEKHQMLVHQAVDRGRGYRASFRIMRPDTGRIVSIEERAEAIAQGTGVPPLLFGFALDVTGHPAPWFVETREALNDYCDGLLAAYATTLRTDRRRAHSFDVGHWCAHADMILSQLDCERVEDVHELAAIVRNAAAALDDRQDRAV